MADLRGRPFAYVALILGVWAGARWSVPSDQDRSLPLLSPKPIPASKWVETPWATAPQVRPAIVYPQHIFFTKFDFPPAQDPWQDGGRPLGLSLPALITVKDQPQSAGRDTPPSTALAFTGEAGPPNSLRHRAVNVYAYSFWRLSPSRQSALAPSAQYGGSQTGVIATFDPFETNGNGPAFLVRAAATPDGEQSEFGLGMRWRPVDKLPVALYAEHRFTTGAPYRFATYLAGGVNAQPISGRWSLDAFGQAGYASGQSGGGFFDAQARAMHPLVKVGGVPITAGVGTWAGGQKGAVRMDAGPTIAATVDAGPASLLLQLDWRIRVAGNAEPNKGLALTVSTGF